MENHPLEPFLPAGARLLMLGSFPPPRKRWCMDFFYPNWGNDMWRIFAYVFYGQKDAFVCPGEKRFDEAKIRAFLTEHRIALFDAAVAVNRLKDNASDKFLQVERETDLPHLLARLPDCRAVATTGQKASEIVAAQLQTEIPSVGGYVPVRLGERKLRFYRMPSSSRAYPLPLERKAAFYRAMLQEVLA